MTLKQFAVALLVALTIGVGIRLCVAEGTAEVRPFVGGSRSRPQSESEVLTSPTVEAVPSQRVALPNRGTMPLTVALPEALTASPEDTSTSAYEVWNRVQSVSGALFDGTARAEDIRSVSMALLSKVEPNSKVKRDDGSVEYRIAVDPASGSAKLIVNPSQSGELSGFVLEVEGREQVGGGLSSLDVDGSKLQILFNSDTDGNSTFRARIEDRLKILDESVHSANEHAGVLPIGASLTTRGHDLVWQQKTAVAILHPIDKSPAWNVDSGATQARIVEKGGFRGDEFAGIQSLIAALQLH